MIVLKCGIRIVTLQKKSEVGGEDGGICTAVVLRKKAAQAAAFKRVEGQPVERDMTDMKEGYGYEDGGGLIETSEVPELHSVPFFLRHATRRPPGMHMYLRGRHSVPLPRILSRA